MLFVLARALLRGTDPAARRPLGIVAAAMVVFTVGDGSLGHLQAHTAEVERTAWSGSCPPAQ
ncbi:hypothetical protein AB0H83_20370 [Dactylosporangium sp. NPDC050688]|uniref:hypothetical protein n=1 Tax=Dactylosporangium sp. NPDC050688 TaxID=3157217 RepID=UPI0033EC34FF